MHDAVSFSSAVSEFTQVEFWEIHSNIALAGFASISFSLCCSLSCELERLAIHFHSSNHRISPLAFSLNRWAIASACKSQIVKRPEYFLSELSKIFMKNSLAEAKEWKYFFSLFVSRWCNCWKRTKMQRSCRKSSKDLTVLNHRNARVIWMRQWLHFTNEGRGPLQVRNEFWCWWSAHDS